MIDIAKKIEQDGRNRLCQTILKMTGKIMEVEFSFLGIRETSEIRKLILPEEKTLAILITFISGETKGGSLLAFPIESALLIADLLQGKKPGTTKYLNGIESHALIELCNVLNGNLLTIISNVLSIKLIHKAPTLLRGSVQEVIDKTTSTLSVLPAKMAAIEALFYFEPITIRGHYICFIEKETLLPKIQEENH